MSHRRPLAITSLAIIAGTLTICGAPFAPHESEGATLAERMSGFQKIFKSKDSNKQKESQAERSQSSRKPVYRMGRPSFRHRENTLQTAQNNPGKRQASASKKSGNSLSRFLPQNLFGSKGKAEDTSSQQANRQRQQERMQQMRERQQRLAQNQGPETERIQTAEGNPAPQQATAKDEVVVESKPVQAARQAPKAVVVRKSPRAGHEDDLQAALADLQDSADLMPGTVATDAEPQEHDSVVAAAPPESAVIVMDDYGYSASEATVEETAEQEQETSQEAIVFDLSALATEEEASNTVDSEDSAVETREDSSPTAESLEIIGQVPLETESFAQANPQSESTGEEELLVATKPEQVALQPQAVEIEDQPAASETPQETQVAEVPFGQAELDVHDALLGEDLYAQEPAESQENAIFQETPVPAEEPTQQEAPAVETPVEIVAEPASPSEDATFAVGEPEQSPVEEEQPRYAAQPTDTPITAPEPEKSFTATNPMEAVVVPEPAEEKTTVVEIKPAPVEEQSPPAAETTPLVIGREEIDVEKLTEAVESAEDTTSQEWGSVARDSSQTQQEQPGAEFFDEVIQQQATVRKSAQQTVQTEPKPAQQPQRKEATRLIRPRGDVLTTIEQPVIVSHVEGPRSILVGKEATYRVVLENTSQTTAENLSASVKVPAWAELIEVVCSDGLVEQVKEADSADSLQWHLTELAAHSSQTMQLQLVPRSGRAFQLGVQWKHQPTKSETMVEVQEPKLALKLNGPEEVLFGEPRRYQLVLENPGNAPAENVAISLIPPGSDSESASTHTLGTLGPQEVKELELELTAREAGEMVLHAFATAKNDLRVDAVKRVKCQKPELEIDWRGPEEKFAGTETAYYFRVRNPGNASTKDVQVQVRLPRGIKFLSASDSFAYNSKTGNIVWKLSELKAKEEQFMQVRCELDLPGLQQFEVEAQAAGGLVSDSKTVRTEVVALADLKLEVRDPRGAQPTGEPVTYEIRVENRGSTDAQGISIVGLFSEGIDPVSVEGAESSVRDGRVNFQPISSLPPGGELTLHIRAVASDVGMHIFRAEVSCQDLDIKLAAEETTRFFEDEFRWNEGETPYTAIRSDGAVRR